MSSRYEADASFECPKCARFVTTSIVVPELDFTGERASENVSEGSIEVGCPACKTVFPAYCFNSSGDCEITLEDHPHATINAELAQYKLDDWVNYNVPDDPKAIFMDSYQHAGELLSEHGGDGAHLINRMIFAQQVGALEAYLADTLVNLVMDDFSVMKRMIAADTELRAKKYTLAEITADGKFVELQVSSYLRSIVYHNIPKVHALYKIAVSVDLFELLGSSKEKLFKAIEYRHDCVHRNGRDSKGILLEVFTRAYVQETARMMKDLVEKIETKVYVSESDYGDLPF
jgi:hypothetical protein